MRLSNLFGKTPVGDDHKNVIGPKVKKHVTFKDTLDPPVAPEEIPKNTEKFKSLNNTLGSVAKGLSTASLYTGMALKGLGKTAGLITMGATAGAVAVPAGLIGLASAGLTYGASRVLGEGHEKAKNRASVAGAGAGVVTAMTLSLIAVPITIIAWAVKKTGKALIKSSGKETPEQFKSFDESFSTHILPLFGKTKKDKQPLLNEAGQEANIALQKIFTKKKADSQERR